ncbi:FAD-dependent oxidoreductase [Vineibacter terrae]|uniref:FAD-dependent oxidoreductase n=1 Tax=Vineibacter terrae TaxID=2586908 RepID=UPI002E360063|nr:FAD-dependent oxidoreductase [Vineibacter terrae]HEX2889418.1 FAD-dependent oxidoreductase [Vineibacter terrae]
MPKPPSPAVLIVGAGATGLALAIDLARRNVPVRLIDKAAAPFHGSRGKGIQPRSLEVLEDLGVLDRIAGRGGYYPPLRVHGPDGSRDVAMMEVRPENPAEPYRQPLMLSQGLTEGVLRERLAELGITVAFGTELIGFEDVGFEDVGFENRGAMVKARIQSPDGLEVLTVPYLVGADGGASFVRKSLGVGFAGEQLPVRAVVADLVIEGLARDAWHIWNAEDRPRRISLCPLAGTELFQLQAALPLDGAADVSAAGLAAMIADRTGRDDIRLRQVHWCSIFQPSARLADRYRVGAVLLAGDAAHVHPPTGGQGLNTSIQDAYNLGWKLAAVLDGAPDSLLDSYEQERRPIAAGVLAHSTGLLRSGSMRRGRENHELDLGYFDSPLALEARARAGRLRAGARAPDAPCRGAGGQPTRLFEVFRGPQATLLGYEVGAEACVTARRGLQIRRVGQGGDLKDDGGHIGAAYDLDPGDWVLVRPDGYVGAIVSSDQAAALDDFLPRLGLGPA